MHQKMSLNKVVAMKQTERSLVLVKPDAVKQRKIHNVLKAIENIPDLNITKMQIVQLTEDQINKHYPDLIEKPFFPKLKKYMLSGPVVAMVIEGPKGSGNEIGAVKAIRDIAGATKPKDRAAGSLRAKYGQLGGGGTYNIIHSSDSAENAEIEITNIFGKI